MSTFPTSPRAAFIEWCQSHEEIFTDHAAAIGLTPAQALAFKNATQKAVDDVKAQNIAREQAAVATARTADSVGDLRELAGLTVRTIRAFAENSANPAVVYNTAAIPAPGPATPAPPPAQPTDLTVTLDAADGNLVLRWKASNPVGTSGTSYIIRRRLPGESEFAFLGVSGRKEFIDSTLIAGPDSVQYTVQGQRADSSGPLSAIFTVSFGRAPGGGMMASVAATSHRLETGATHSTVNGQPVQKVLPGASAQRANARM